MNRLKFLIQQIFRHWKIIWNVTSLCFRLLEEVVICLVMCRSSLFLSLFHWKWFAPLVLVNIQHTNVKMADFFLGLDYWNTSIIYFKSNMPLSLYIYQSTSSHFYISRIPKLKKDQLNHVSVESIFRKGNGWTGLEKVLFRCWLCK